MTCVDEVCISCAQRWGNTNPFQYAFPEDIIIIPAFGTTLEILDELEDLGVDVRTYDTTCPFVEKFGVEVPR